MLPAAFWITSLLEESKFMRVGRSSGTIPSSTPLSATANSTPAGAANSATPAPSFPHPLTDGAGRSVTISKEPWRIASLFLDLGEVTLRLIESELIVAVTRVSY